MRSKPSLSGTGVQKVPLLGGFKAQIYDNPADTVDNVYHGSVEQSIFTINMAR